MKFPEEAEAVEKQARLAREAVTAEQDDPLEQLHYFAGVEEALIWVAGKGTSERIRGLVYDAEYSQEIENELDGQHELIDAAKQMFEPDELGHSTNTEYVRGMIELISQTAGLSSDAGIWVARRLGLSDEAYEGLYKVQSS